MKAEARNGCTPDVFNGLQEAIEQKRHRLRREASPRPGWVNCETLENRRLLSASLVGSVLTITGGVGNDVYEVYQVNGSPTYLYVVENGNTLSNTAWTSTAVTRIDVSTAAGTDAVTIQRDTTPSRDPINEVAKIWGGDGNDTLSGGPLADTMYGGEDEDELYGYGDNDLLYGGYGGMDTVEGGNGADTLYGGDGGAGGWTEGESDTLRGDEGNDVLRGEGGGDDMDGGADNDALYGGSGGDSLTGGTGNDYLSGEGDNDSFWAEDASIYVDSLLGGSGSDQAINFDAQDTFLDTLP